MNQPTQAIRNDMSNLVEDVRDLFDATSDSVEEKVVAARKRLAATLDQGRRNCDQVREKAVEGVNAAAQIVRGHLCATIGTAFAVGALFGGVLVHRK